MLHWVLVVKRTAITDSNCPFRKIVQINYPACDFATPKCLWLLSFRTNKSISQLPPTALELIRVHQLLLFLRWNYCWFWQFSKFFPCDSGLNVPSAHARVTIKVHPWSLLFVWDSQKSLLSAFLLLNPFAWTTSDCNCKNGSML